MSAAELPCFPARRNPDGYVAQRILGDDPMPWLLTFVENGGLNVARFSDVDVAGWRPLYDELDAGEATLVVERPAPAPVQAPQWIEDYLRRPEATDWERAAGRVLYGLELPR